MQANSVSQTTLKMALLLLFSIKESLYAIDTRNVIEIVPAVLLRKFESAPRYVAGVFNYHNTIVPVVDLCQLIHGTPCQICYSTRLIMVNYSPDWANDTTSEQQSYSLGLLAERVTETLKVPMDTLVRAEGTRDSSSISPSRPESDERGAWDEALSTSRGTHRIGKCGMGELFIAEKGIIQYVNWEHLIADDFSPALFVQVGQVNGTERH